MKHPYTINAYIKGLGRISDIFKLDNGNYQYLISNQYYHQSVVDNAIAANLIFIKIEQLCYAAFSNSFTNFSLLKCVYNYLCTDAALKKFNKYDKRIVSKFVWLKSNIGSAYSHMLINQEV